MAAHDGLDYDSVEGHYSDVVLTIRILMGKEILPLIGEYGEVVRDLRNQSDATITITDSSTPERIVTVTGNITVIQKAFTLITQILEQNCPAPSQNNRKASNTNSTTVKLIVPASQCGSLIGKGGVKIREIREASGAMVNVASDLLPNSTERTVSISGSAEGITEAIHQICIVILETPGRGPTVAYRPIVTQPGPVVFCGGQAYTLQGTLAIPAVGDQQQSASNTALNTIASIAPNLIAGSGLDPSVLAALAGSQLRGGGVSSKVSQQHVTHEMAIPNDIIGCIIGKGGTKIAEIRRISGAMIRISNTEEHEASGKTERAITISGQSDAVNVAKTLISISVDQYNKSSGESAEYDEEFPPSFAVDAKTTTETLATLLSNPNSLGALGAIPGLKELLGSIHNKKQLNKKRDKNDKFSPYN